MYKVCIIGCGMIAESAHLPAYRYFGGDFDVSAVFDVNAERAEGFARRNNIKSFYIDADEMLEKEKPDIVSVCVPNKFHSEFTLKSLLAGANVICEKPLAVKYKDALEMYALAEQKGKILLPCQSMRFTPDRLSAKKYIEQNGIGELYYAEFSRIRRRGIPYWGNFHIKDISLGGALCDIGVHMLDTLIWLTGNPEIKSVIGHTGQNHKYELGDAVSSGVFTGKISNQRKFNPDEMDVEDFAAGSIILENGAVINFKVAWAANMPECTEIKILGRKAGIELPEGRVYSGKDNEITLNSEKLEYDYPFAGHYYIIENMKNVIEGTAPLAVTPEEAKKASAIIEMFYISARKHRMVDFSEIYNM